MQRLDVRNARRSAAFERPTPPRYCLDHSSPFVHYYRYCYATVSDSFLSNYYSPNCCYVVDFDAPHDAAVCYAVDFGHYCAVVVVVEAVDDATADYYDY